VTTTSSTTHDASEPPDTGIADTDTGRAAGSPALTISICPRCGGKWFPPREVCSGCAHDQLDVVATGPDGVAYASTVVRTGPPGFAIPYVLSYVDVDGVRILAHADSADPENPVALPPGTPVTLIAASISSDRDVERPPYRVRPASEKKGSAG
jgi:uncharacterized OB-fold protein